jgi:hypothetical protein
MRVLRVCLVLLFSLARGLRAQGALYGPALGGDALANTPIGKGGIQVSCRFRADPGGVLRGARPYLIWSFKRKGYHAGTGGTLNVELQEDDGTPRHAPSGRVLARQVRRLALMATSDRFYPLLEFDRAPRLAAGTLYHLVFSNVDPDPEGNFVSLNALFLKTGAAPLQPGRADTDWAMLLRSRIQPDWAVRRTAGSAEGFTPILEIDYADGRSQGMGYVEFWMGAARPISGPAAVRESFTVTGLPRQVLSVAARVRHLDGAAPLHLRLEQADGRLLAEGDGQGPPPACSPAGSLGGCDWVRCAFRAPVTLVPGRGYHLVLGAPATARYEAFPMRKGSDKGFSAATLFTDGHAECTAGGGWTGWTQWGKAGRGDADLQFYFQVSPGSGAGSVNSPGSARSASPAALRR